MKTLFNIILVAFFLFSQSVSAKLDAIKSDVILDYCLDQDVYDYWINGRSCFQSLYSPETRNKINFDSAIIIDFGERLKSVLTSFMFSDVSNNEVSFFTVNQWFDKSFFNENAMQNLHFPSIDLNNLNKFNKKFLNTFNEQPNKVSILAYDALGLIYYCWANNNFQFKPNQLYNKEGFKGLHGEFLIENNISKQKLKIYKVGEKKFIKVY